MYHYDFHPTQSAHNQLPLVSFSDVPANLSHHTKVEGEFNGEKFVLDGGGDGNPHEGELNCKLYSQNGPVNFPMALMNVVVIFGYPTYSKHINVTDIFKCSDGYEYERHIEFENGGKLHSLHKVNYSDTKSRRLIEGNFEVKADNVTAPNDIIGLNPILETFIPAGKGRVRSKFMLEWITQSGHSFLGSCESEYRLNHNIELPNVLYRYAEFVEDRSNRSVIDLDERIWVVDQLRHQRATSNVA